MMFVIAFSIVAMAGLGLALLLRGMAATVNAVEDLAGRTVPVDLEAFRTARDSGDAEVAEAGRQLASLALAVRFYVVLARLRLAMVYLWPSRAGLLNLPLADQYDTLVGRFRIVGQLQDRARASRLMAAL